jgi:hypothetical protein
MRSRSWYACRVIRLQRSVPVGRVDVPTFLGVVPPLLQCLRDLKFDGDGVVETADGRALEGLRVTDGTHPGPGTCYSIVTRLESTTPSDGSATPADGQHVQPATYAPGWQRITITSGRVQTRFVAYAAELVADDGRTFQVRGQEYGGGVELLLTLPDPRRPTRLDLELRGYVDGPWPIRGPITGSATIALNRLPPAHAGTPQVDGRFRHRRVAGRFGVTVAPDTDARWLATIDIRARLRGFFLLAAPFSRILRTQLQRELDDFDLKALAVFDEFTKVIQERFGPSPDPSMMAAAAVDALLAGVAEVVPEDTP